MKMHKIVIFGKQNCQFTHRAIDEIQNNCVYIETDTDYENIDEPFKSIISEKMHVTSPCIFLVKYLGGNKDLDEYSRRKPKKSEMQKNDYMIFGRDSCPYTVNSLKNLKAWNLNHTYIRVNSVPNEKMASYYFEMAQKLKHRTAPCIFVIKYIGTCSNLIHLNEKMKEKQQKKSQEQQQAIEYVEQMNTSND